MAVLNLREPVHGYRLESLQGGGVKVKPLLKRIAKLRRAKLRAECDLRLAEWQLKRERRKGR